MKTTIYGAITLLAIAAISGAYAQGGYGEGTRIMPHASPAASATAAGGAKTAGAAAISAHDKEFINKAAHGGLMEVAMGQVAEKHATNADVKKFGQRMVHDHGKANEQLSAIAASHGLGVPKSAPASKWTNDKDYMTQMVADHEKDLAEFKNEASHANDPQLKKFAVDGEKMVADHLKMAKQIHSKL